MPKAEMTRPGCADEKPSSVAAIKPQERPVNPRPHYRWGGNSLREENADHITPKAHARYNPCIPLLLWRKQTTENNEPRPQKTENYPTQKKSSAAKTSCKNLCAQKNLAPKSPPVNSHPSGVSAEGPNTVVKTSPTSIYNQSGAQPVRSCPILPLSSQALSELSTPRPRHPPGARNPIAAGGKRRRRCRSRSRSRCWRCSCAVLTAGAAAARAPTAFPAAVLVVVVKDAPAGVAQHPRGKLLGEPAHHLARVPPKTNNEATQK